MSDKFINASGLGAIRTWVLGKLGLKQDTLVSGTNIKTINNEPLLGSGNINTKQIFFATQNVTTYNELVDAIDADMPIYIDRGHILMSVTYAQYTSSGVKLQVEATGLTDAEYYVGTNDVWTYTSSSNEATETISGTVKLNPSEYVTLNANGQLDVGGRLGQMPDTTGVYSPKTINPQAVGNGSFLLTEASGLKLGNKSMAVVTGSGLSLKTAAAAGATTYLVSNTYENRIICAGIVGGVIALNEATAAENYVNVIDVTIGGYAPNSNDYWTASGDITITTDKSINPSSTTKSIRPYCCSTGFSNFLAGQQSGGDGGASVVVGQKVKSASGNACAIVGGSIYNTGNGNAVFGRQHISKKNRSFLAGTGHDTTNGPSEGVAAFGQWSDIKSDTSFAIGNGTSATARSNSFEIDTAGDTFLNGYLVLKSPNGTQYKVSVDDNGNLVTSAL